MRITFANTATSYFALLAGLLLSSSTALAQQKESTSTPPVQTSYPTAAPPMAPGPFLIQSADGKSRMKVGGLIQSWLHAFPENGRTGNSNFSLRRARLVLDGTLFDFIDFRVMPEFGEGRAFLQDAYIDLHLRPQFRLRTGKFKTPYSLERLQAASDVPFLERSIAGNIIPIRDVGVMLMTDPGNSGFEWELAILNGVVDNAAGDGNADNALEFAARFFYQPFRSRPTSRLRGLGFGAAATTGSTTEPLSGQTFRTAGRSAFFRFADGVFGDGERTRFAPQFFYYTGSFGILGEHFTTRQEIRKGTAATKSTTNGFNIQATYILTGESTSFRNPVPRHPYDPATGRGGAYELAIRYSQFRADSDAFSLGLVDPITSADKADAFTIGINAYLNRQLKAQLNYERTDFKRAIKFPTGTQSTENAILAGLQLNF